MGGGDETLTAFESASGGLRLRRATAAVHLSDGDCIGLRVVEGCRSVEVAEPGQIMCTAVPRVLARERAEVEVARRGPLS
jgi:hypothetical protein